MTYVLCSRRQGALYESPHEDENDVQTISHKCDVLSYTRYKAQKAQLTSSAPAAATAAAADGQQQNMENVYYLAGFYDPTTSLLKFEGDVKVQGKTW